MKPLLILSILDVKHVKFALALCLRSRPCGQCARAMIYVTTSVCYVVYLTEQTRLALY